MKRARYCSIYSVGVFFNAFTLCSCYGFVLPFVFTFGRFHLTPGCISSSPRGKLESTNSPLTGLTSPPSGGMRPLRRSASQRRDCEPSSSSEHTESTSSSGGGREPSDDTLTDFLMVNINRALPDFQRSFLFIRCADKSRPLINPPR